MTSLACPPAELTGSPSAPSSTTDPAQPTPAPLRDARTERNRANAQHSTGPRTPAGKVRSAQNARTHGLSAATPPTEVPVPDPTAQLEYTTALQELIEEHRPATPTQHILVKELALVTWKLQYLPRVEHRLLNTPLTPPPPEPDPSHLTPHPRFDHPADPTARVLAAHFASDTPTPLTRLFAYHHRLQARVNSLLNQLRRLRRDRQQQKDDDSGATRAREYNRRQQRDHDILAEESRRIHEANQRRAEEARRAEPRQTAPTCSNSPAGAKRTQTRRPPSVSSVSSVAEHPVRTPDLACTPVQPDATTHPPAQNEATSHLPLAAPPLPSPPLSPPLQWTPTL